MNNKAFTLIEVMIITVIIGLLVTLIFPNINRARIESNHTFAKSTLNTVSKALEMYQSVNHKYPTDINELLTAQPPYLYDDYFNGLHKGYTYTNVMTDHTYEIVATPNGSMGTKTFKITTGNILTEGE